MTSEEGNHDVASSGAADPFDCDMPVQESQEVSFTIHRYYALILDSNQGVSYYTTTIHN